MADIRITPASSVMSFTSSLNYIEKITQDASGSLNLYGSGSTGRTEILSVDGNNGRLFTVSDDLSDSLFSVNTIAGLPVIEAFADNKVVLGQYGQNVLVVTGSKVGIGISAPQATLDVSASIRSTGYYGGKFEFYSTYGSTVYSEISPTFDTGDGAQLNFFVKQNGNPPILRMRIRENGNVFIGASAATNDRLEVQGTLGLQASALGSAATQILVTSADPSSTTRTVQTRTPAQIRSDIGAGTVSSIATNNGVTGGTITSTGTIGLTGQALALHNLATNGLVVRTGAGTVAGRTLTGTTNQITVTNGDGVSGNPTISLPGTITGLTSVTSTTFVGALSGNATSATTATNANNVAVTDTTTGTGPYYIMFADGTTDKRAVRVDSSTLQFNATTNTLTVPNLAGTASWATNATTATTATSANTLTNTRTIWGQNFNGSADITGNLTSVGTISGSAGVDLDIIAGAGARVTLMNPGADAVRFGTDNTVRWIVDGPTGNLISVGAQTIKTNTGNLTLATNAGNGNILLTPNGTGRVGINTTTPTSASLTVNGNVWATSFTGSLFGTASFASQALSASFSTNADNVNISTQNTTPVTYNIVFTGGTSGNNSLNVDSTTLTYNPSTSTLTTGYVVGTGIIGDSYLTISSGVGMFNDGGDLALGDYNGEGYSTGIYGTNGNQVLSIQETTIYQYVPTSFYNFLGTGTVNGEIAHWGAGSVTAGNLYYYDSSGNWTAADADAESTSTGLLGIARATGTAGTVGMLLRGHARFTANSSYTGTTTTGAKLYASTTAGAFSQTAPTGTGKVVRIIGYVQSTSQDQIYFCPDNTWVTLA